ncbi:MAG: YceI family protein [Prolixibacteraceae bacterium]|nr:YceI family protein [Prolixibacteraceae bacterium]
MKTTGKFLGTLILFAAFIFQSFATKYELDKNKSTLNWTGEKVVGKHFGTIDFKTGNLEIIEGKIVSGSFDAAMQTIVCKDLENESFNKKLVGHLNSDDFFSTEKHPFSSLRINRAKMLNANNYQFEAELTIKDITHPVIFNAEVEINDSVVKTKGTMLVDRTLYDIKYGSGRFFSGLGDNMISDHFALDFVLVANAVTETASTAK